MIYNKEIKIIEIKHFKDYVFIGEDYITEADFLGIHFKVEEVLYRVSFYKSEEEGLQLIQQYSYYNEEKKEWVDKILNIHNKVEDKEFFSYIDSVVRKDPKVRLHFIL